MKNLTVARRYAKALYQLAQETKTVDDVHQGLSNLCQALKETPQLGKALFNPLVKPEEKAGVVKAVTSNKLILKFIALLAERKRMDLIPVIFDEFTWLNDVDKGIQRVIVKSAAHLSEAQKKMVEKELAGKLGGKIIGKYEVAKELLGGIWIKLGDRVLDVSVRGRFDDLRRHLIHSVN